MDEEHPTPSGATTVALSLRLYVHGNLTVADRLRRLLDDIGVQYELEVVDVDDDPMRAEEDRILVTPTLMRLSPPPQLRVVGDLSDLDTAVDGLGLRIWQRHADDQE